MEERVVFIHREKAFLKLEAQFKKEIQVALIEGRDKSDSSLSQSPFPTVTHEGQLEKLW